MLSQISSLGKDDWAIIIAFVTLIATVIMLIYTYRHDIKVKNKNNLVLSNTLRLDFSKRYQDLMTAMPEPIVFTKKYAGLYFDLCAEEYRLQGQGNDLIDPPTWKLWKEGMESTLKSHPELRKYWRESRRYYDSWMPNEKISFQSFFDELIEHFV